MITRTFKLCLNAGTGSAPYINVNQYDEGETWLFELYTEQGERYMPNTGAIVGIKSDGKGIANTGTVDSNGRVVITETEQMTASAGLAIFELSIDGLTHGTANFAVQVERKPTDDAIMSDSDYSMFQEAIDAAEVINDVIGDGDPSEVIGEHVDAWLDNHPEATTTVQDGAITAPKINQSLWDKLLVSEEASGAVASFDDGADDVPVSSLKVALEPIQTGTGDPSPTNIRPITGHTSAKVTRTGKNMLPTPYGDGASKTTNGITYTVNADGSVTANGTATANNVFYLVSPSASALANKGIASGTYVLSGAPSTSTSSNYYIQAQINGDTWVTATASGATINYNATAGGNDLIRLYVASGAVLNNVTFKPMLCLASETDATYEPYQGNTYTIDLNGTRYGGTVDLATGVLTVDKAYVVFDGSEAWSLQSINSYGIANFGLNTRLSNYKEGSVSAIITDKFKRQTTTSSQTTESGVYVASTSYLYVRMDSATVSTVADFKTWLAINNMQCVYDMGTPTTVQLTPTEVKTLLGYNNISSSGTVEVIYHADTKLYVDKMTNVDNAIIAPTEADFVATRNYTVNDLVIVNDTLYKVTANIANGGTITPNSNVTQTTLGALIKALS